MKVAICFMLTIWAAYGTTVDGAPRPHAAVAVRTYNYAVVGIEQMSEARSEAAHIFKGAGISLDWIECRVPSGGAVAEITMTNALLEPQQFYRIQQAP